MNTVLPLFTVVLPKPEIAPSIVFIIVDVFVLFNVKSLLFSIELVKVVSSTFNTPPLVTAAPLKPYTSPTFLKVNV